MNSCALRIWGALGLCLTWAAGWAVAGLLIGVSSLLLSFLPWEAFFKVFDAPLPALAMPGFIGGAIFSLLIGLAEHRRKVEELPLPRFAAWGAVAGLLLCLVPVGMVLVGLATLNHPAGVWKLTALICGPLILMGVISGLGSLLLARMARPWKTLLRQLLASNQEA